MQNTKDENSNQIKIKGMLLWIAACCIFVMSFGCKKKVTIPTYDDSPDPIKKVSALVIVNQIDEVNGKITLRTINYDDELRLSYNGGADVLDQYGDVMFMSQVKLGAVAEAVYDDNADKLLSLHMCGNDVAKKLEHVSGAQIDVSNNTMRVDGQVYKMSGSVTAFSGDVQIDVDEICTEDEISVWFYNDIVCAINVELGHGYLKLKDYSGYIGGMVEVGYDVIVPVTEDMLLTVREGSYVLRIVKGENVGTKKVDIVRNQETILSLADIAIEPKQMGSVMFKVTPSNARVYIDGKQVNTEGAVSLEYGKHAILIQADGYESYSANFNVNYAYKIKEYVLNSTDDATKTQAKTTRSTKSKQTTSKKQNQKTTEKTTQTTDDQTTEEKSEDKTEKEDQTSSITKNKVMVSAPSGASVYFDGEYIGIAPISFTKVTGSHIITFSQTGYLSKSYTVTFTDDGKDETLTYDALVSIASLLE